MTIPNFAFSGAKQSGKDTAASMVAELTGEHQRRAFADKIKQNLIEADPVVDSEGNKLSDYLELGRTVEEMKEDKSLKVREWLQDHGQEMRKVSVNYWTEEITREIDAASPEDRWTVPDMRFHNEAEELSRRFFTKVYIQNDKAEKAVMDAALDKKKQSVKQGIVSEDEPLENFIPVSERYFGKLGEDHVIENNGTIEEFRSKVAELVRSYAK